jgi:hypothetical protein
MSDSLTVKAEALEPLFAAWEEPTKYRARNESGAAIECKGRRPSGIAIAQNLRTVVKEWRENFTRAQATRPGSFSTIGLAARTLSRPPADWWSSAITFASAKPSKR